MLNVLLLNTKEACKGEACKPEKQDANRAKLILRLIDT